MHAIEAIVGIVLIAFVVGEVWELKRRRIRLGILPMNINQINREAAIIIKIFMARKVGAGLELDQNKVVFLATPSTIVYRLRLKPETPVERVNELQNDFLSHINRGREDLGIIAPDDFPLAVRVDMVSQTIEVSRVKPEPINFDDVIGKWTPEPATALCGVAHTFKRQYPVVWRLNDSDQPHVLIAGTTGSGKTNELMSVFLSLALHNSPDDLTFSVIDMKHSRDLKVIEELPHVKEMAKEDADALSLLRRFHAEMESRERGNADNRVRRVLVIDELASLTESDNREIRTGVLTLLNDIGRKCRENNMNMVLCTQSPKAEILGNQLKGLLALRLVGKVTSKIEANTAINLAGSGAEMLPGKGAMIYRCGGTIRRFQAPLVLTPYSVVRRIVNHWGKRLPMPIASPLQHEVATITTTTKKPVVAPVVAMKSQKQLDADLLREPWKADMSQAEMIRIMLGRPGDMAVNTGGANRKRMFEALELLQNEENAITTITTTQQKQPFSTFSQGSRPVLSSSGSGSSDLKPM